MTGAQGVHIPPRLWTSDPLAFTALSSYLTIHRHRQLQRNPWLALGDAAKKATVGSAGFGAHATLCHVDTGRLHLCDPGSRDPRVRIGDRHHAADKTRRDQSLRTWARRAMMSTGL